MYPPITPDLTAYFVRVGKLVGAAYDDSPRAGVLEGLGYELVALLRAAAVDDVSLPFGFIARKVATAAWGPPPEEFVVAIRGTETVAEWTADADATQVDFPVMPSTLYPRAHRGFARIYNTLRTGDGLLVKHFKPLSGARVVVAGHSLGAALATLLAADLGADDLVTFAGPRVGNGDFCSCAAKRIGRVERFVNERDLVTKVPFDLPDFPYADLGVPILFDSTGKVLENPHAHHSLATYLNALDAAQPLDTQWAVRI